VGIYHVFTAKYVFTVTSVCMRDGRQQYAESERFVGCARLLQLDEFEERITYLKVGICVHEGL
jgi:hypothetical protein